MLFSRTSGGRRARGAAPARKGWRRIGAGAVALALAGGLGWAQTAPATAATVYEIEGEWQAGTPNPVKTGDNIVSVWRYNINDDAPAPGNAPVDNVTVNFTVQHGVFTVLPEACLVEGVDPASQISADGSSLRCNLGTRDQGSAELLLAGIRAVGNSGDRVSVGAEIGGVTAQLPEIPIKNVFAMDMKWDGGTGTLNEGTQQKANFPWSLRHAPGGEPGPQTITYDLTFTASGGEVLLPHADGCDVIPGYFAGHPRSDADSSPPRRAPFVTQCKLEPTGTNTMRLTLTGIDYSKTLLPTEDSGGAPLPTDWDVVAAGEVNVQWTWKGTTTLTIDAKPTGPYVSVDGATSNDLTNNNSTSRAVTRGIFTGGWRFSGLRPQLPGTQWTDTSRAMAGDTILANAGVLPPAPGEPSAGLCVIMDSKYVDFVDAVVGSLEEGVVTPYPGITYWYYTGTGVNNNLNPNSTSYNPNTFTCDGSGWTTTKPSNPASIRAVRAEITAAAGANVTESLAMLYVHSRIKSNVPVGQDIWTWMSYNRNGGTSWQNPTRSTNPSDVPATGTLTPGTRYPFTSSGRDIMRVIAANPRVTKVADQDYSVPGATVQYTVTYRAEAGSNVTVPNYTLTDTLPAGTSYVPGSASTAPSSQSGQKLTWNLANVQTNTDYVMTYSVRLPADAEPGSAFTNEVTANISGSTATATDTVRIRDGGLVLLTKTAAASKVPHNGGAAEDSWTVRLTSTDTRSSAFTDTIDVLPYNGDGRGTSFTGGYRLSGPVQAAANATVYYTTADPATLVDDPAHASNGSAGNVSGNTVGWSTDFTAEATAVRVIGPALAGGSTQEFVVAVVTEGATHGDRYVNRAESRASRQELRMRTSGAFEIGAVNSVTIKKYVADAEQEWHDANDIDDAPSVHTGDTLPYRLVITNTGDQPLQNVVVTDDRVDLAKLDPLPEGLTVVDGKAVIPELQPGEENQLVVEYQVPVAAGTPAGNLVNTACVVPQPVDPDDETAPSVPAEEDCDPAVVIVQPSSLSWEKVAAGTPDTERLAGSEWELTPVDENDEPVGDPVPVTDCVADSAAACDGPDVDPAAGAFRIDPLDDGRYRLVETRAPAGYQLDATPRFVEVLGETALEQPIENVLQEGPELPLTGGVGTLGFWVGTGLLSVLAAGGVLWQRRRRRAGAR
ncbi:SpaA isopeptide-forming pilin-related protein [Leucobacter massiliensis]|uniref:DUF11 domain-containing protein n=1 Tax=Leucobacter massiliensis TaxID=1686285 RepID=A0A2S9QS46_9MICO|nr:SpaA isopeptide-forming pilin-related protein [Leucobacter massiliensis]PRI12411.1 hypothetical protein B4915_01715 [Leucobacter massiliensis]